MSGGSDSEEDRDFLRARLVIFGFFGAGLGYSFWIFRILGIGLTDEWDYVAENDMLFHLAGATAFLVMGLVCKAASHSRRTLEAIEAIGVLASVCFYVAMGSTVPAVARPDAIVLLAIGLGLIGRAIYVPSTALRTGVITALSGLPFLVMVWHVFRNIPAEFLVLIADAFPGTAPPTAENLRVGTVASAAMWWLLVIVTCVGASRVIYGLRRQVNRVQRLGQYELIHRIGAGGMGQVFSARHAMLQRPTAVKLLPPDKLGAESLARFEREVKLTAQLTHPNTVTIYDYGRTPDGLFYYAMELLAGADLATVVEKTGPMPSARVAYLLGQAASALQEAHGVGLIHRDIKPQNLFLCELGGKPDVVKVVDFGLVKQIEERGAASLTQQNVLTGTPDYMSPEAIKSPEDVDNRSDLYALGAVAYFLITGERVFEGETIVEVCSHHLHTAPTPPSELVPEIDPALEGIILRCLEKEPDSRPASAKDLSHQLFDLSDDWSGADARRWWDEHRDALTEAYTSVTSGDRRHLTKAFSANTT